MAYNMRICLQRGFLYEPRAATIRQLFEGVHFRLDEIEQQLRCLQTARVTRPPAAEPAEVPTDAPAEPQTPTFRDTVQVQAMDVPGPTSAGRRSVKGLT